ncbi:membrane-bound lytic murein transglycosylase MltF [candidate division KSB3 bacterium]|uniref:Membrane-bound lytic murein transglycosylase MltF n=1 Tax=candidate division KSB3 bacterium TaxID=2044937 RepID=A0A2G6KL43_9BACT|nr:MAG: membrane-bound lytic murein transglycosylase MltF [candidate division KSB3 bacterium]
MKLAKLFLVIITLTIVGCSDESTRDAADIKQSGKLIVLTRNAPSTWYVGRDGQPVGPEYDMVESFAAQMGVTVEYVIKDTVKDIMSALEKGEGDIAAAGLTVTDARKLKFQFSPAYLDVTQQVVCRRDKVQPESVKDLIGLNLTTIANSSYSERLSELKTNGHPDLQWSETGDKDTEHLLAEVSEGLIDCTIADSHIVDINRRYLPRLMAPFNLTQDQSLAWAMQKGAENLKKEIENWFGDYKESGRLGATLEKYYGFFDAFDYVDVNTLHRRIKGRFPKYEAMFKKAADKYNLPYSLLAAQGYQESHWNAKAKSPTGVRGIMMLTRPTAKAMGVKNRLNPEQSINGGAKYLARLKGRLSDEIKEPDRTWLALAAYNVGMGHLHDAQTLARKMKLDPYSWRSIREVLPLLSQKRYYKELKYGYARGSEPVKYVQRIREYQHVIDEDVQTRGNVKGKQESGSSKKKSQE